MSKCSAIKANGQRCGGRAIDGSQWCWNHDPAYAEARQRNARKGGKRGGRSRPSAELARIQARFEDLVEKVLTGEVGRADGAVAGQLLGGARACVRDGLAAREQEELAREVEELRGMVQIHKSERSKRWG